MKLSTEAENEKYLFLFFGVREDFLAFMVNQYYRFLMKHHNATVKEYLAAVWESVSAEDFIKSVFNEAGEADELKILNYFRLGGKVVQC